MADMYSIRITLVNILHVAWHLWPRFLVFIFCLPAIDLLFTHLVLSQLSQGGQALAFHYASIAWGLIMAFAYLCAWSWILSGWIRHELVPDDMSHPLPAGAHFRALCWHQFCVGLICGLISLIVFLPAWVLMITYGLADTYGPEYPISDVSFFIAFIILTFIAIFIIELFYLRYSVGIMSLTLYGQKMSLGEASAYRSEHEPIGLTRHFAFYTACYLVAIGAIGELIRTAVESAIPSIQIIDYLSMLTIMPVHLVAVIGVVALITGYLKNMPPHH